MIPSSTGTAARVTGAAQFFRAARLVVKSRVRLPGPSFGDAFLADVNAGPVQTILDITDALRFAWEFKKEWKWTPNVGHVTIYNLSPATRALLQGSGNKVLLYAGYGQDLVLIGTWDARVNHKLNGDTWETKLEGGDGGRAFDYARLTRSYAGGARLLDVANDLAASMGMSFTSDSLALLQQGLGSKTMKNGFSSNDWAQPMLRRILLQNGMMLSTQDGQLLVLKRDGIDGFVAGQEIVQVGSSTFLDATGRPVNTGLVGSPEYASPPHPGKPQLYKIQFLLNGQVRVGHKINVKSKAKSGLYKVWNCTHKGDTWGGDWLSVCDAQALSAGS